MPPEVMKRLISRDITGKEGSERIRVLRRALDELPGYYQGPYGKLRKWINQEIEASRQRAKVTRREGFQVPKEGHRQFAVVGPPNAGKSALLHALSGMQVKVADYPFATLRPQAALVDVGGAKIQFVEIPGLLPGAGDDRGGGRALLGAVRTADAILYVRSLDQEEAELEAVMGEVDEAGIELPGLLCLTGLDRPGAKEKVEAISTRTSTPGLSDSHTPEGTARPARLADDRFPVVICSTVTGEGLESLKTLVWSECGLVRVWRRGEKERGGDPFVLEAGATTGDLARAVHKDIEAGFTRAVLWGPSARFPGQTVGRNHVLADGDEVELRTR